MLELSSFFKNYFGEGRKNIDPQKGFYPLPENGIGNSLSPVSLKGRKFYLNYVKCEPETVAHRFISILVNGGFEHWAGMSLRRFFSGNDNLKRRHYEAYPATVKNLTEKEEEGPNFETIPPLPGREYLFNMCGLSRLRRLGVLEIIKSDEEDILLPTEKLISDIKKHLLC